MFENFIWDFDGMLFDTYPHTVEAFCRTLAEKGKEPDREEAMSLFKVSMLDAFRFYGVDEKTKADFYELENDIELEPQGVPYEGIPRILSYIKSRGGRNFLFTHRDKVALSYLEKYSLMPYFSDFVLRDMGFPLKPAPDGIEYLIKKHSLSPSSSIMLGDRSIDIFSGINAGISTCLFDENGNLSSVPADFYCRTVDEVFEAVKKYSL